MNKPRSEKTVLIVKPDGVKRGLVGEVIKRIEQRGLKVIALKMINADKKLIDQHLPKDEHWLQLIGQKSLADYANYNMDAKKFIGTDNPEKVGRMVRAWLFDYWTSGPVVAMVIEGIHAIDMVRKIVGNTLPSKAEMGTIRGDYSVDSAILANLGKRAVHNLVHASGNPSESRNEIKTWFDKKEINSYSRVEEETMF